jgi:creatinine amidohydrolase
VIAAMGTDWRRRRISFRRPIEEGDWNLAFLFPHEVAKARAQTGLVILPLAPIEWHGPHLAMGCDGLLAHAFARRLARELESPYFPPLFVGTERERHPNTLRSLGFSGTEFIEGMDFPANTVKSAYMREEFFSLAVRGTLDALFDRMGYRSVVIVNGHGAENQSAVLNRLCAEYNAGGRTRLMWVYPGFPRSLVAGSIGHAAAEEASMLSATWPHCVDLSLLPREGKLRNVDHAVVDGDSFDGAPTADFTVREQQDPRRHTDASVGAGYIDEAAREAVVEIRAKVLSRR